MDFHSVMETFAEAWVAANTHTPLTEAAEQGLINGPTNHPPPTNHTPQNGMIPHPPPVVIPPPPPVVIPPPPPEVVLPPTPPVVATPHSPRAADEGPNEERRDPDDVENPRSPGDSPHGECPPLGEMKSPYKTLSNPHGKSLPVHCIVEQIPGPQACGQYVELDSYAIVPNDTLFSDLVRTALAKLGYSTAQILGAKGSIQVKKWKPLAFDQVTENPEATVADILGELTTVASLHVRLYSVPDNPQEWRDITVRNAVLELLREMSQSKLAKLCPLSQPMLSNIINNRYMGKIGKEKCQEFGQWYLAYRKQHPEGGTPEVVPTERPLDGRLTFHPLKELPMMRDWFHGCRNPSKRTLQMYVDILNQGPVRQQERPKVVLSTLKNWWKNEKQRERKNLRSDDPSPDKESGRPKRKRRSCSNPDNPGREDSSLHHFSGSSSQDAPPKPTNNFTMIHHDEPGGKKEDPFAMMHHDLGGKKEDPFGMIHHDLGKKEDHFAMIHHHDLGKKEDSFAMIHHHDLGKKEDSFTMIHHHDLGKKEDSFAMIHHHDPDKKEDNPFAMIHHDEGKKEERPFDPSANKDKFSPFGVHSRSNGKFTVFSHIHPDGSIERFLRKEEGVADEKGAELFQKGHAPLFGGFPVGVAKGGVDDSRVSSEDDVDVGI